MTLPYASATSGEKALDDLSQILTKFGCTTFGTMTNIELGEVMVQFIYRKRNVSVVASYRGYAAAWLKYHPYSSRIRCTQVEHERKAMAQARISVCSILRDWIKGQVTAVEIGMLSFEGAFLGQILLPNGQTILQTAQGKALLQLEGEK